MKLIDPVLLSKWGGHRIRSEYTFTDGRVGSVQKIAERLLGEARK